MCLSIYSIPFWIYIISKFHCAEILFARISGISTSGTEIQSVCGNGSTGPWSIPWSYAYIQMTSDGDGNVGKGFKATAFAHTRELKVLQLTSVKIK